MGNYIVNKDKFNPAIGNIVSGVTDEVNGLNDILQHFQDNDNNLNAKISDVDTKLTDFETRKKSSDMLAPSDGNRYTVTEFRNLIIDDGYRMAKKTGQQYVDLEKIGLVDDHNVHSAFIEKISEHFYELILNHSIGGAMSQDIMYLNIDDLQAGDSYIGSNSSISFGNSHNEQLLTTKTNKLETEIGDLNTLTTKDKASLVDAINENHTKLNSLGALTYQNKNFGDSGTMTFTKKGNTIILGFDTAANANIAVNGEIDITPPSGFEFLTDTVSTCSMFKNGGTATSGIRIISKTKGTVVGGTLESSMTGSIVLFAE